MTDKNPPSFPLVMKTGFNLLENNDQEETEKDIVSLVTLFGKNALETAAKYVTHGKRTQVTLTDIRRAMMFEVFAFTKRPDLKEKATEMREEIFSQGDGFDEYFEEEFIVPNDEEEDFANSSCVCALCTYLNMIENKWKTWKPDNALDHILKKHIDDMPTTTDDLKDIQSGD